MKKLLAMTLSIIMMCGVLSSCGGKDDDANSKDTTTAPVTTTAPADTTPAATTTAAEEVDEPKAIDELSDELKSMENCSVKWSMDTDVEDLIEPFAEKDYENDESHVKLSMEELDGIPMIKVETLDKNDKDEYKIPKIKLDMAKLFKGQESDLPKIFTIKIEFVTKAVGEFTGDDGNKSLVPGNFMGVLCTQPIDDKDGNSWNELLSFGEAEWTSEWAAYELSIRPGIKPAAIYQDTTKPQYLSMMKWSIPNQADFYIANITFLDEAGEIIECNFGK